MISTRIKGAKKGESNKWLNYHGRAEARSIGKVSSFQGEGVHELLNVVSSAAHALLTSHVHLYVAATLPWVPLGLGQ